MPKSYLKQIGDLIGRYRITGYLGIGEEADVYQVIDEQTGDLRSLKLLRGRNMMAEAQCAADFFRQLVHCGHVKRFHHLGVLSNQAGVGERPYLVFEFVEGDTLDFYLTLHKRMSSRRLIQLVGEALAAVHRTGLAIGDLGSHGRNILIELETNRLVFCDLDYGKPGRPNRDQQSDLVELRKLARFIYRASFEKPDPAVLAILDSATSVAAANLLLKVKMLNATSDSLQSRSTDTGEL